MNDIYYDPFDFKIVANGYPVWKRMRDDAPLYRNEKYDFWALTRFADVKAALHDWRTYSSARGSVLEVIKSGVEIPRGNILFEDPPAHDLHRGLLARVFSPRRMAAIEPEARAYCARSLDPLVGKGGFDFIADLGSQMPMRVIGMLLGIPEQDQEAIRDQIDAGMNLDAGEMPDAEGQRARHGRGAGSFGVDAYADYIAWRRENPADDLITELINARFVDESGVERNLADDELIAYIGLLSAAGNETTTRLIGWLGYLLDKYPEQRQLLVENPQLVASAVEEALRFEAPSPVQARYVMQDVEHYGTRVPEGSVMLLINGAASRDEREYADADRFDIRREAHHLSLGYGIHFCLGNALARIEGRVALEEVLKRWPEWQVDHNNAKMARTSTVRGWESLPAFI